MDYQEIRDLIANARKVTPVTVYVRHEGELEIEQGAGLHVYPTGAGTTVLLGEWAAAQEALERNAPLVHYSDIINDRRNSAIPLLDL